MAEEDLAPIRYYLQVKAPLDPALPADLVTMGAYASNQPFPAIRVGDRVDFLGFHKPDLVPPLPATLDLVVISVTHHFSFVDGPDRHTNVETVLYTALDRPQAWKG